MGLSSSLLLVLPLEPVLLSSTLGLEEEGLEEEGFSPQFGRCSSASVVVVMVDVGALVVNSTPPLSTKANSLLPTPN